MVCWSLEVLTAMLVWGRCPRRKMAVTPVQRLPTSRDTAAWPEGGSYRNSLPHTGSFCGWGVSEAETFLSHSLQILLSPAKKGKAQDTVGFCPVTWEWCLWYYFSGPSSPQSWFLVVKKLYSPLPLWSKKAIKQNPIPLGIDVICLNLCSLLCPIDLSAQV